MIKSKIKKEPKKVKKYVKLTKNQVFWGSRFLVMYNYLLDQYDYEYEETEMFRIPDLSSLNMKWNDYLENDTEFYDEPGDPEYEEEIKITRDRVHIEEPINKYEKEIRNGRHKKELEEYLPFLFPKNKKSKR